MNEVMKELGLSEQEWHILSHRLEVPEAIGDAIGSFDDQSKFHRDDVEYVAECLMEGDWDRATCHNPNIRDAVLVDAVEGSTYYAVEKGWGKASRSRLDEVARHGRSLAKKVAKQCLSDCDPLEFPTW